MTRLRVFLAACVAAVSFGFFIPPAHALVGAMCDTNRGGFAYVPAVYTGQTTAINACIQKLDNADGCWSGWWFWGNGSDHLIYKSRTKVSSLWCGYNTTPVHIRVWLGFT